jgi:hypothetical protein
MILRVPHSSDLPSGGPQCSYLAESAYNNRISDCGLFLSQAQRHSDQQLRSGSNIATTGSTGLLRSLLGRAWLLVSLFNSICPKLFHMLVRRAQFPVFHCFSPSQVEDRLIRRTSLFHLPQHSPYCAYPCFDLSNMPSMITPGAFLSLCSPSNWDDDVAVDAEDEDDEPEDGNLESSTLPKETGSPTARVSPPWCWPAWQAITGRASSPFSPNPNDETPDLWGAPDDNDAVWAFVTKFWGLPETERVNYIHGNRVDNDSAGRRLYLQWFKSQWARWGIRNIILDVLVDRGLDPYSVVKRFKHTKVSFLFYFILFQPRNTVF